MICSTVSPSIKFRRASYATHLISINTISLKASRLYHGRMSSVNPTHAKDKARVPFASLSARGTFGADGLAFITLSSQLSCDEKTSAQTFLFATPTIQTS
jgi:hypothetical protein